jgi:hypothetical protein
MTAVVLRALVGIGLLVLLVACGATTGPGSAKVLDESGSGCQGLVGFVRADEFIGLPGSAYPRPATCPAQMKSCVEASYEENSATRSLLAEYFLRYDAALLDRRLLDADFSSDDLISVLWAQESQHCWQVRESASTLAMREHIHRQPERFPLTKIQRAMLDANQAKLAAVMAMSSSSGQ